MKRVTLTVVLLMAVALATAVQAATSQTYTVSKLKLDAASWGITINDFNHDDKLDFVNWGINGKLYLYVNTGGDGFSAGSEIGIVNRKDGDGSVSSGDFNSDGWPDIALVDYSDTIHVFLNNKDNTFSYTYVIASLWDLVGIDCADMNGDSKVDIAVCTYSEWTPGVLVYDGDGAGNFLLGTQFNPKNDISYLVNLHSLTVGDFNNDGYMDIAVGQDDDGDPGGAWLYRGTASGNYVFGGEAYDTNPIDEYGIDRPGGGYADAYDFNRDGNLDIVASTNVNPFVGPGEIMYFTGDGSGSFPLFNQIWESPGIFLFWSAAPPLGWDNGLTFSLAAGHLSDTAILIRYNSDLLLPSVSSSPCDGGVMTQPVQASLTQPIKGAMISLKIPAGVADVTISRVGLFTENWNIVDSLIDIPNGIIKYVLANTHGYRIPTGTITLFNVSYKMPRLCGTDQFVRFDTALSDDPSRATKFSDTLNHSFAPMFDRYRDSSTVAGYLSGDADNSGAVDISDLFSIVDYLIAELYPCIMPAMEVNGQCGIDIGDLTYLIDYLQSIGPDPMCGCLPFLAKVSEDIGVTTSYVDGFTTISVHSLDALRGLQLELVGTGPAVATNLTDGHLDLISGKSADGLKLLLVDLKGRNRIEAGDKALIRVEGQYQVTTALASDTRNQSITASINGSGKSSTLPTEFALSQNYPNPFNPTTTISFSLPTAGDYKLTIYNVAGQMVKEFTGDSEAGEVTLTWDGTGMASGVYLYRLSARSYSATKKMILLK